MPPSTLPRLELSFRHAQSNLDGTALGRWTDRAVSSRRAKPEAAGHTAPRQENGLRSADDDRKVEVQYRGKHEKDSREVVLSAGHPVRTGIVYLSLPHGSTRHRHYSHRCASALTANRKERRRISSRRSSGDVVRLRIRHRREICAAALSRVPAAPHESRLTEPPRPEQRMGGAGGGPGADTAQLRGGLGSESGGWWPGGVRRVSGEARRLFGTYDVNQVSQ